MPQYLFHVNNPNNKARIHAAGGVCVSKKGLKNISSGGSYGPIHGDRNGYWDGPYSSCKRLKRPRREQKKGP
jgi:hypothetical protein